MKTGRSFPNEQAYLSYRILRYERIESVFFELIKTEEKSVTGVTQGNKGVGRVYSAYDLFLKRDLQYFLSICLTLIIIEVIMVKLLFSSFYSQLERHRVYYHWMVRINSPQYYHWMVRIKSPQYYHWMVRIEFCIY